MAVDYLPTLAEAPTASAIPGVEERKRRERIAAALLMQGSSGEPIQHWAQGLNRVAQGLVGGYQLGDIRRQGEAEEVRTQAILAGLPGLQGAGMPSAAMPQRAAESESPAAAPAAPVPPPQRMAALGPPAAGSPGAYVNQEFATAQKALGPGGAFTPGDPSVPRPEDLAPRTAALTSPTVPGAVPVPTQVIRPPTQMAQASPVAATAAIHPAIAAEMQLGRALALNRPTRDVGLQMYMKALQAAQPNYGFHVVGENLVRTDPRGGQAVVVSGITSQKPAFHKITIGGEEMTVEGVPGGPLKVPQVQGLPAAPSGPEALPAPPPGLSKAARDEWQKEQVKLRVTREGQRPGELRSAKIVVDDIDRAMQQADEGFVTGISGQILSKVGGTAAHDLAGRLQSIKANISIDKLNAMRAASPTGGALGNVTEGEHALLSATLGSVEQSQSKEQFKENLGRLKELYNEVIHGGVGKGPPETGRLPARVNDKAAYDALPSGAKYIAPDGSVRTKK